MAGDYHLQANVDMRALAIIAKAKLDAGVGVRSIAQLAKDVIEQAAIDLIEQGAESIDYSEDAMEMLQRMGLLRPSGTNRVGNFKEHLRAVGSQTGFQPGAKDLETKEKRRQRHVAQPTPDMMQAALDASKRLQQPTSEMDAEYHNRVARAQYLIASTDVEEDEGVGANETPDQQRLRREREHQETLRVLRDSGEAPLESLRDTRGE